MTSESIDAVLFDLDDTLVAYRRTGGEVLAAAFEAVGVDPFFAAEDYYARYEEYLETNDTIRDLRRDCFADLAAEAGRDAEVGRAVARAYAEERDQSNVRPLSGAREAVETLAADHRVGLVTNGAPEMQRTKLAAVGLDDAFETTVFAGHDAARKPDPEPFERALADLGVDRERAVHVGNSLGSDVAGAHAAGLGSVWLRAGAATAPDPTPRWTVGSLSELVDPPWR